MQKPRALCFPIKAYINSIINTILSPQPKDSYHTKALATVVVIPCKMAFLARKAAA